MRRRIEYTDEPLGELQVVRDLLPPPEQLVLKEETVNVTISLSRASVDFFKRVAKANNTSYQKLIRHVLDLYTRQFESKSLSRRSTRRAEARR